LDNRDEKLLKKHIWNERVYQRIVDKGVRLQISRIIIRTIRRQQKISPLKTLSRQPFMLMLHDDSGEVSPVKLDPNLVTSDNAIIVLDEYNDTTWVFIGRNVNMPTRMHALRMGKSLQKSGYKIGDTTIGMASDNLVEMLEKDDSDADVAGNINSFREVLNMRWSFEDNFLAYTSGGAPAAAPAPAARPVSTPSPEPAPVVAEPTPAPVEPVTPTPAVTEPEPVIVATTVGGAAEQKTAYLLLSAVKNANLIYAEKFERDGKSGIKLEAPGVMVIEAIQDGDELRIEPSDFGTSDEASKIKADYETWLGKI
jgi:hypothetical protein